MIHFDACFTTNNKYFATIKYHTCARTRIGLKKFTFLRVCTDKFVGKIGNYR